jgi:hypothetical protein
MITINLNIIKTVVKVILFLALSYFILSFNANISYTNFVSQDSVMENFYPTNRTDYNLGKWNPTNSKLLYFKLLPR